MRTIRIAVAAVIVTCAGAASGFAAETAPAPIERKPAADPTRARVAAVRATSPADFLRVGQPNYGDAYFIRRHIERQRWQH